MYLRCLAFIAAVFILGVAFAAPDGERDFSDSVKDTFHDELDKLHGGECLTDDQCSVLSYCRKNDDGLLSVIVGHCFLSWWVILAAVLVVVILMAACCACICCPCCCLYACCDSLCCC